MRIHHYESWDGVINGSEDRLTFNDKWTKRLDYLLFRAMEKGIYVTTDLFTSRPVMWRDVGIDRDGQVPQQVYKNLIGVHEPAFENWKTFSRNLLTHVNPYTGRAYKDEPGLPLISLINEGHLTWCWDAIKKEAPMKAAWRKWLAAKRAADALAGGARVAGGAEAVRDLAAIPDADLVVCAMVGMAALGPVLAAIDAGHDVALATKEVLVAAGELVTARAREKGVDLLPIDSEHSAIFQALNDCGRLPACVRGRARPGLPSAPSEPIVRKLWLTASGGPFFFRPEVDFAKVTPALALKHPRWRMGPKVTIDSATMMNKGLEILEARWLFDVPADRIGVLVHPESIVHSLVEFEDGAQLAQLGVPDMRLPIQYAMTWPDRAANGALPRLSLAEAGELHFREPDPERFPCLRIARDACAKGGTATCAMNAANEVAVQAFLAGKASFPAIWETVGRVADETPPCVGAPDLGAILAADAWARARAAELLA